MSNFGAQSDIQISDNAKMMGKSETFGMTDARPTPSTLLSPLIDRLLNDKTDRQTRLILLQNIYTSTPTASDTLTQLPRLFSTSSILFQVRL